MLSLKDYFRNTSFYFNHIFDSPEFTKDSADGLELFYSGIKTDLFNYILAHQISGPMKPYVDKIAQWVALDPGNMCLYSRFIDKDLERRLAEKSIFRTGYSTALHFDLQNEFQKHIDTNDLKIEIVKDKKQFPIIDEVSYKSFHQNPGTALEFMNKASDKMLDDNVIQIFLAKLGDKYAGLSLSVYESGDRACIYWLGVDPKFRKKGIAKNLILQQMKAAQERGIRHMLVTVFTSSENIFRKIGFEGQDKVHVYVCR